MRKNGPMLGFLALTALVVAFAWFLSDERFAADWAGSSTGSVVAAPARADR